MENDSIDNEEVLEDLFTSINAAPQSDSTVSKKPKQKSYRKRVETSWSHENILKLISEVELGRSLWDIGCAEYKLHKDSVWQEVADAIPVSFNDCKGRWSNLRTTFNVNLEKMRKRKSGQGTDEASPIVWKYFKSMLFLESNKMRQSTQSTSSMQLECTATDEHLFNDLVSDELPQISASVQSQPRNTKASSSTERNNNLKEMAIEALNSMRSQSSQPKDSSTALGEYIVPELRSLPAEIAAHARGKLRPAFADIMDELSLISSQQPEIVNE